ncbi:hypothetical protein ABZ746_02905 [Streptomyces sp. NPDC020096]
MGWDGHWHGYGWIGSGEEYRKENLRRPGREPGDPNTLTFLSSPLPPIMTGHWLLKKRCAAADRTWTEAKQAVAWLRKCYEANPPFVCADGGWAYVDLEVKIEYALDMLPRGVDATWVHWVQSQALFSHSIVCCPSHHHPEIPCPLPPT